MVRGACASKGGLVMTYTRSVDCAVDFASSSPPAESRQLRPPVLPPTCLPQVAGPLEPVHRRRYDGYTLLADRCSGGSGVHSRLRLADQGHDLGRQRPLSETAFAPTGSPADGWPASTPRPPRTALARSSQELFQ